MIRRRRQRSIGFIQRQQSARCCTHLTRHDFPPWPSYIPQRSPTKDFRSYGQNPIIFYVGPNLERVKILPTVCGSCVPPAC